MNILLVDDHPVMLNSIGQLAQEQFPESTITSVGNVQAAQQALVDRQWQLMGVDLSLPQADKEIARSSNGLELLRQVMNDYPEMNLMVCSSNLQVLVQLKQYIDNHQGGFTIAAKSLPATEIKQRLQYAADGLTFTKDIRRGLELKPEWLKTLQLGALGLQDRAISEQLHVTERAVRHYWTRLQDVLEVYGKGEEAVNLRVLTLKRAREQGLLDD